MTPSDEGGDPACWAHLDLDANREPERAGLEVTDAVLAAVARSAPDAVIVVDRAGVIRFWNGAAERVFGWSAAEAVGTSLDLIIPERNRAVHWAGFERVMATGETRYATELLQTPALTESGGRLSVAFTVTLVFDASGAVAGIAAILRDETARRAAERELRERAAQAPEG